MKTQSNRQKPNGFALIVTLSLMILLTVVAVGLLTLSSISLRATSRGSAQAIANSNARLALMLAIGELQKNLGPDQSISANASVLDAGAVNPNAVGAWESLGWDSASPDRVPSPSDKAGKFRSWLLSTKDYSAATDPGYPQLKDKPDSIWLANPDTSGKAGDKSPGMRAEFVPLTASSNRGGFAWMVSDSSTKASIGLPGLEADSIAKNVGYRTAPPSPRVDVLDSAFAAISGPPAKSKDYSPGKLLSMQTAVLAVGQTNKVQLTGRSQSLTTTSLGVLADPVLGGLKKDLTPLMESSAANTTDLDSALGQTPYFTVKDGAPTWAYLRSHYQLYRTKVQNQGSSQPRVSLDVRNDLVPGPGIVQSPQKEVLLPVIAKLQIMFSLVSHRSHLDDRVKAFNERAVPKGNEYHAVPHLAYDPIVTLYNPYDVSLSLPALRVRVSDPPVGFQFQKRETAARTTSWFRQEFANGEFHGLGRFQIAFEHDANARRYFILYMRDKTNGAPGGPITLLPGEVKVFMPWVKDTWNWGVETAGGINSHHAFFDWNAGSNMGTEDLRTNNKKGLEAVPGVSFRAGLQTDHLSYANGRPADSKYSWETSGPFGAGWLSMKLQSEIIGRSGPLPGDEIIVKAKPVRTLKDAGPPDFRVDILAGANDNPDSDLMRTYEFRMSDPAVEMSVTGSAAAIITRKFLNSDILQAKDDMSPGGKSPFAIFTMSAKTTKDSQDDSKAWAFNNFVTHGASQNSGTIGNALQSYDLRLEEVSDFTQFPGVEIDEGPPSNPHNRGYFGAKANSQDGVSIVPMYRVPITPAASLGDWVGSNLVMSSLFPRVNYPLGNSFAHPLLPSGAISAGSPADAGARVLDHSYLMNASMWDRYYFSSATDYTAAAGFQNARTKVGVLQDFFGGGPKMLNSRLTPYLGGTESAVQLANTLDSAGPQVFADTFGAHAMVAGAFNINSDSVDAWRSVLSSLRDVEVDGYAKQIFPMGGRTSFVRNGLPVVGSPDNGSPGNAVDAGGQVRWAGFRSLDDDRITALATNIVQEIRARAKKDGAPLLSVADFVNRRPGSENEIHALRGILQTAIDNSKINDDYQRDDSKVISGASLPPNRLIGVKNKKALDGFTADGAAPMLSQGDLMTALAPIVTARGDTFTIRTYGEARNRAGNAVEARAWCEATVQRVPDYVDSADLASASPGVKGANLALANRNFGRRFVITSFRWLNPSEV